MFPQGLMHESASMQLLAARLLDVLSVVIAAYIAHFIRFGQLGLPASYNIAILISVLLTLIIFSVAGVYLTPRDKGVLQQFRIVSIAWLMVMIAMIVVGFLTKTSVIYSRQWIVIWAICGWILLFVFRFTLILLMDNARIRGFNRRHVLIIGVGELAQSVGKKIKEATWTGLDVIGFVNNNPNNGRLNTIGDNKIFSDLNEIATIVDQNQVNEVWIALPLQEEDQIKEILNLLRHSVVTIRFVPGIFEYRLLNHTVDEIAGLPVIDLNATPMVGVNRVLKALEDRLLSLLILILVSPLLALIALSIKLTSKGPVLFKQMRLGWDGKPIKIYKFRTMIVHKEDDGKITQAKKGDQRITKVGTFLRKTSMDELPQFWNVLQGRMSIVGPRPHALIHNEQYKLQIDEYMQRHKVKPGITGWAQIHGWRGETDTLEKMKRRVEYDLYYIENWSLWLDLKIILYTLFAGFINKNAY